MAVSFLSMSIILLVSTLADIVASFDRLSAGEEIFSGDSITQNNGAYRFTMQENCNLILYGNNLPVWQSWTNGSGPYSFLSMQTDGNLVIYMSKTLKNPIWTSNTNREDGYYYCILQSDRNVVIYDNSNNAIWATGTNI